VPQVHDARKRALILVRGLRLVMIEKAAFTVRSRRIVRDRTRDIAVVREHLGLG